VRHAVLVPLLDRASEAPALQFALVDRHQRAAADVTRVHTSLPPLVENIQMVGVDVARRPI